MKSIDKNLVKAIVMGIVLASPYSVQAAEYNDSILGSKDSYGSKIKTNVGDDYTYTFSEDSTLKLVDINPGTGLGIIDTNKDDKSITVNPERKLNIVIENSTDFHRNYDGIAITASEPTERLLIEVVAVILP